MKEKSIYNLVLNSILENDNLSERVKGKCLDYVKDLKSDNESLKQELEEEAMSYDIMFDLSNKRKFIRKFNKEFDKEDKKKNPYRDYYCIYPDAEEVYKRYYNLKDRHKKLIKNLRDYINFLVIFHAKDIEGRFRNTIWGQELLDIIDGADEK